MFDQLKKFITANESELVLTIGVILISLISFAAGRLTAPGNEMQPISIEGFEAASAKTALDNSAFKRSISAYTLQDLVSRTSGQFTASKNSNKYYLPNCSGVKRIAEHNKIWFNSREEAEGLGYTPAANCPGLLGK